MREQIGHANLSLFSRSRLAVESVTHHLACIYATHRSKKKRNCRKPRAEPWAPKPTSRYLSQNLIRENKKKGYQTEQSHGMSIQQKIGYYS